MREIYILQMYLLLPSRNFSLFFVHVKISTPKSGSFALLRILGSRIPGRKRYFHQQGSSYENREKIREKSDKHCDAAWFNYELFSLELYEQILLIFAAVVTEHHRSIKLPFEIKFLLLV